MNQRALPRLYGSGTTDREDSRSAKLTGLALGHGVTADLKFLDVFLPSMPWAAGMYLLALAALEYTASLNGNRQARPGYAIPPSQVPESI